MDIHIHLFVNQTDYQSIQISIYLSVYLPTHPKKLSNKIGVVRVTVYRQLEIPVLLYSRSLPLGVNFAFVSTPKSAVKSSRKPDVYSIL